MLVWGRGAATYHHCWLDALYMWPSGWQQSHGWSAAVLSVFT